MNCKIDEYEASSKYGEVYVNILVDDILNKTDVAKIMRCFRLNDIEKGLILSRKNTEMECSINKKHILEFMKYWNKSNSRKLDTSLLVRELMWEMQMGYHLLSDDEIRFDNNNWDKLNNSIVSSVPMNFKFDVLKDSLTDEPSVVVVYFEKGISLDKRFLEVDEILKYLELV